MTTLIRIVAVAFAALWWRTWPSFWSCSIFWATYFVTGGLWLHEYRNASTQLCIAWVFLLYGGTLNAVATVMNGGYMPVSDWGNTGSLVHVPLLPSAAVPYLTDILWGNSSAGDVLMLTGIMFALVPPLTRSLWRRWYRQVTVPSRVPLTIHGRRESVELR